MKQNILSYYLFIMENCSEALQAIILLERSGVDSVYEGVPIGREHHPGSKNPIGSSGGDTVRDREYQ
jgi:hypothetical protein